MRVLYVATSIEMFNRFLTPHVIFLIDKGYQIEIACNIDKPISKQLIEHRIKIDSVPFQRNPLHRKNLLATKKIKEIVQNGNFDLIHVHNPTASFITRFACRNIPKIKVIYTSHGFNFYQGCPFLYKQIFYWLEKMAARWTHGIITINKEDYQVAKKLPLRIKKNVFYMHGMGLDLSIFCTAAYPDKDILREKYGYSKNDFILISVADLNENKHQDFLFSVIKILQNKIPGIKLLLVGNGRNAEKYRKSVFRLGIAEHVDFLGYRKDVPDLLISSDVLVSASYREGLGMSLLEASALGIPVVASNNRGHRELIKYGINGHLVDINNAKEFTKAIEELFNVKNMERIFNENNFSKMVLFSIENVVQELETILKNTYYRK